MTVVKMSLRRDSNYPYAVECQPADEVTQIHMILPPAESSGTSIRHLPQDVADFFDQAWIVLQAGVPDAAAVQLRKTLEAAAAHKGISSNRLVEAIREMVAQGMVTRDFGDALDHIRKVGNSGAHYNSERLTADEVETSYRFTTQLLRNLFEVPGELREIGTVETDGGEGRAVQD